MGGVPSRSWLLILVEIVFWEPPPSAFLSFARHNKPRPDSRSNFFTFSLCQRTSFLFYFMAAKIIDDRDSSVKLSGSWSTSGTAQDYGNTVSVASMRGDTATLTFTGSSVAVYGRLQYPAKVLAVSNYRIDNAPLNTAVFYSQNRVAPADTNRQLFFQSPTLAEGQHSLTIFNELDGSSLILDYFSVVSSATSAPAGTNQTPSGADSGNSSTTVVVTAPAPASPSNPPPSISGSTPSSPGNTSPGVIISTVTAPGSQPSGIVAGSTSQQKVPQSSHPNTAAIVGAVLGGVVLLAALIGLFLWLRRRQKKNEDLQNVTETARPFAFPSDMDTDSKLRNEMASIPSSHASFPATYSAVPTSPEGRMSSFSGAGHVPTADSMYTSDRGTIVTSNPVLQLHNGTDSVHSGASLVDTRSPAFQSQGPVQFAPLRPGGQDNDPFDLPPPAYYNAP